MLVSESSSTCQPTRSWICRRTSPIMMIKMILSRAGLASRSMLIGQPRMLPAICVKGHNRSYRGHNSIMDMLSASEAWHALVPDRPLGDEKALRSTFDRLDLDGSGKIDRHELKQALLQVAEPLPGAIAGRAQKCATLP